MTPGLQRPSKGKKDLVLGDIDDDETPYARCADGAQSGGLRVSHTSDTPLKSGGDAIDPAVLRPELSDDVIGANQTRELNSVMRGR